MTTRPDAGSGRLQAPYQPAEAHLTDLDLVTADRTGPADKHLANCGDCQRRLAAAGDPWDVADEDFAAAAANASRTEAVWRSAVLPDSVRRLVAFGAATPEVAAGQVWRLEWGGRRVLVAVIDLWDWHVLVAPVTTDIEYADELTHTVRADETPLGTPLAVFVRLAATVPLFAFDSHVVDLPAARDSTSSALLKSVHRAHLSGTAPADGRPPTLHPADTDRVGFLDALAEALRPIVDAGRAAEAQASDGDDAVSLQDALAAAGMTARDLMTRVGVEPARALKLVRGELPTDNERQLLEQALGVPIASDTVPDAAIAALSSPALRSRRIAWNAANRNAADADPTVMAQKMHARTAARSDSARPLSWTDRAAMFLSDNRP